MNEEIFLIICCVLILFFIKDFITVFIVMAILVYLSKYLKVDSSVMTNYQNYSIMPQTK
jgi:hypothetical protein